MPINVGGITLSSSGGATFSIDNGATPWLKVDSSGRMTREQPVFYHGIFGGQGINYFTYPVKPATVRENRGGAWNASTGLFTCPVAGKYLVGMNGIAAGQGQGNGASHGYFAIMKNGGTYVYSHWSTGGYWGHVTESCIMDCALGDTISFSINTSPGPQASPQVNGWYAQGDHGNFFIGLMK